jgi:hypothetical protein
MMRLRFEMLQPLSITLFWKAQMSSEVAVSGERLRNAANRLQLSMWPALRVLPEVARDHVVDHALAQRADGCRCALLRGTHRLTPEYG